VFELHVVEDRWVIFGVKHELKVLIIDYLFDFLYVGLVVDVLQLKTELQILIVKHSYVRLRVVVEHFDHSSVIYQVVLEKCREFRRRLE